MKLGFCTIFGMCGGLVAALFGGWSDGLTTLLIFMTTDYITGLIVAGVFHRSEKTENGRLESCAGLKGLFRKGMMLFFVMIGYRLDLMTHMSIIRDGVCIAFCANEMISITENAGAMGVPIPPVISKAIEVLHEQSGEYEEEEEEEDEDYE